MSNTITLKKSGVSGNAPSSSDLSLGEVALNYADGHLYYKSGASATPAKLNAGNADTTDGFHLNQDVRSTASPSFAGLDINGAADISGNLEVGEYILRSGQGSNYHRFLASRQIFVVGNASSIDLNNGTSTFGATGGATTLQGSSLSFTGNATFAGDIILGANHIGRDGDNYITFVDDNVIKFRANGATQVKLYDGVFAPQTDSDVDIGTNSVRFANGYFDTLYGDGSNLTNLPSGADNTKLPLSGGTMTGHILLNNAIELRSKDTSSNIKTIARVNSSNQLEYGWSGAGPVKFMGGGSYTERMRVHTDGNIGIGTTSPSTILEVSGAGVGAAGIDLSQGEASTISNRLFFSNATANQGIAMYNLGGKLVFGTGATAGSSSGDARMYLTNTGNVGIGTSSPSSMLHLEAAVSPALQIKDTTNNVTFKAYAQDSNSHLGNTSNHDLFIDTNNASRITVKADGNVGIGTTSPTSKLHISEDGGQVRIGSPTTSWGGVGFAGSLTAANAALWGTATKTNIGAVGSGSIEMKLGNDAGGNGSLKMEADKLYYTGGNLGIGTTSPDHELHVKGDITIDNESSSEPSMLHFNASNKSNFDPTARINFWEGDAHTGTYTGSHAYIEYNGSTAGGGDGYLAIGGSTDAGANSDIMVINRLGRVGIGAAVPKGRLHVLDGTAGSYTPDSEGDTVVIESSTAGGISLIGTGSASVRKQKLVFGTIGDPTGAEVRYDPNNSFMSVGTTAASNYLKLITGNGTEAMRLAADGNVGIGVASPATQLHVNGEVRVDANDGVAVRKIRSSYFSSGQNLDLVCGASASLILGDGTARLTLASDDTATFAGDVVVSGGLTINGTTTTINSTTLQVDDKNIELGTVATPTDTTADGGGITLKGATDKTINWVNSTDAWTFSERISITPNGSASLPALTFGGDNDTGIYRFASGSDVYIGFSTAGTGRGHFGPAGITSNLNLYSASGGEFRNYGGTWKATTGTTNKGFQFINSVDGTALTISSTGDTVASGSVTATSLVKSGGSSSEFLKADGSVDSSAYLSSNQTITLGGDVSGSGTTSISVSLAADSVGTSEIAANAVGSSEIADNAVTAAAIAANAVGTSEIASSAVGAAQIAANAVRASELSVSGNGSTSQFLRSDGDGTFTWATPVDTNTVYTHPTHDGDDINIDTGALTGATVISDLDFNVTTDGLGHVTDANGTVSTRTLTAANLGISAPNAPASASVAIVGETVEVTFAASTTSNIDAYLVYSSIDGSDYGLISVVPPDDFAASMSIIDNAFDETGTQAYRVYAMKYGILSSAATASVSYAVSSAEPTSMSVVNLNNAYYVQWNPPSSNARFVTAYNVYKHEHATQGSLSRSSASLVYSGMNTNYMYQISGTNNNNFHQFWVETTIA